VAAPSEAHNVQALDESDRFSTDELVADLQKRGQSARSFLTVDQIVDALVKESKPGNVIVLMSNGSFGGIYQKLLARLV